MWGDRDSNSGHRIQNCGLFGRGLRILKEILVGGFFFKEVFTFCFTIRTTQKMKICQKIKMCQKSKNLAKQK